MSKSATASRAIATRIRTPTSASSTTDFVAIAITYAEEAIADTKGEWACLRIRQAARRFLKDLGRCFLKRPPFVWSAEKANRHCRFIETLPHIEGEWDSETIVLQPAQIFFVVQLFGFRKHDGTRRFTECLYATARKNAKSTIAAAILLSCFCLERENGAQLVSAATTGKQARIIWGIAKRMVEKRPQLRETFDVECFAHSIARYENGATFQPINSKASTQDGLNPSHTSLDEIHAHKTHDLLNVLRSAAGARRNPLWLYTTTEGYESPGPWPELRAYGKNVLDGVIQAEHFLVILYMLDDDDDELEEKNWPKANPLIYVNPIIKGEMQKLAVNARAMPSVMSDFRIKRCNLPSAGAGAWVNLRKWNKCSQVVDREFLRGHRCFGALDLASTLDMNSWRLLWMIGDDPATADWYTWGRFWVPRDQVRQRSEGFRVKYDGWVERGLVQVTEGDAVDYSVIEADVLKDFETFAPSKIGYDPWNAGSTVNNLTAEGLPLELFIQGPKSYNAAMKACEVAYLTGKFHHGDDPVLRWHMSNLIPRKDANNNEAPDRRRSADKIDGACTLFMCFGMALSTIDQGDADGFFRNPVR